MMRKTQALITASALALVARLAVGCATSEHAVDVDTDLDGDRDAGVVVPATDAAVLDGGADGDALADAAPPTCSADGWCHTTLPAEESYDASAISTPTGAIRYGLRAVRVLPDGRAWAVSSVGHVLLWDGEAWHVKAVAPYGLRSIWAPSATELWVAGERGLVMRGTVTGSEVTFERATLGSTQVMIRIVGTSASDVWVIPDGLSSSSNTNRVFRLNPGSDPPSFSPLTVPSSLQGTSPRVRVTSLWTVGSSYWLTGHESSTCVGSPCKFTENVFAVKWIPEPEDGAPSWEWFPVRRGSSNLIPAATTTDDGVHLLAVRGDGDDALVVRVADDESKLDAGDGDVNDEGSYAWTEEHVDNYGQPAGLWATRQSDVWVVGKYGLVRHFDGTSWKLVRTSLTNVSPVLADLYDVHGAVGPSGDRHVWIVGDDVALHRKFTP